MPHSSVKHIHVYIMYALLNKTGPSLLDVCEYRLCLITTLYAAYLFCCARSESSQIQIHMMNNCGTSRFLYWSYFWAYSVKINKNFQELGFVWNDFHFSVSRQFAADAQRICVAPVNRYWAVPIYIIYYILRMLCIIVVTTPQLMCAWEFHNHGRIFSINKVTLISSAQ